MLGVSRPRVSAATAALQRVGLIKYQSGHVQVLDRAGLEAAACECYQLITSEYQYLPG
jgi:Mn-dependent DtxR family transcriptional regulator